MPATLQILTDPLTGDQIYPYTVEQAVIDPEGNAVIPQLREQMEEHAERFNNENAMLSKVAFISKHINATPDNLEYVGIKADTHATGYNPERLMITYSFSASNKYFECPEEYQFKCYYVTEHVSRVYPYDSTKYIGSEPWTRTLLTSNNSERLFVFKRSDGNVMTEQDKTNICENFLISDNLRSMLSNVIGINAFNKLKYNNYYYEVNNGEYTGVTITSTKRATSTVSIFLEKGTVLSVIDKKISFHVYEVNRIGVPVKRLSESFLKEYTIENDIYIKVMFKHDDESDIVIDDTRLYVYADYISHYTTNYDSNEKISYLIPVNQTNEYANTTQNSDGLYTLYDSLLGVKSDGYAVTKTFVGKDQSDTYDIYKYEFEPKEYDRTILISTGMHGIEIVPVFTIFEMMKGIVNNPNTEFYRYMHDKVKVIVVPLQNPWGFNQSPRLYPNSRLVNENRNFAIKTEWENFDTDAYGDETDIYKGKGTSPFSEKETQHMRDVLLECMHDIDFWFDCHTSKGWDYDYYVQCNAEDTHMHNAIQRALDDSIIPYLKNVHGITNIKGLFNDPNTALKLHYAYNVLHVSCCTVEMTPKRFGGEECGAVDITTYLLMFSSYVISALNEFDKNAKIGNVHKYASESTILKSPNGTRYKVTVDDNGGIITEEL